MLGTNWDITPQKEFEELLRVSNQRNKKFEEILDKTSEIARIGAWEVDLVSKTVIWDKMTKVIHEVDQDYVPTLETGINFYKKGESRKKINELINKSIEFGVSWDEELQLVTAKGVDLWVRAIGQSEIIDGDCIRLYGVFQDISHQKNIENSLTVSGEQFKGAFEYSAIGMALVLLNGNFFNVNKELCSFFGYSKEELLKLTFQDITHPEDLEQGAQEVKKLLDGEIETSKIEKRYFHKNESIVWALLSISLVRDSDNVPLHFVSQIENITERKKASQELVKINQELTAILNSGYVSIIGTDLYGRIIHFNQGAEALLGYSADEILYKQLVSFFHTDKEMVEREIELSKQLGKEVKGFDVFIENPEKDQYESRKWTYVRKDGSTFTVQLVVTPVKDKDEKTEGYLCIATDISELEKNRQHLKEAKENVGVIMRRLTNRNDKLAKFAQITSHNLRAPVSNLNSLLGLYNSSDTDAARAEVFLKFEKVINHLTETLNYLVESLVIQEDVNKELVNISIT